MSDTTCKPRGYLKLAPVSIVSHKDSQNALKGIILAAILFIYYREGLEPAKGRHAGGRIGVRGWYPNTKLPLTSGRIALSASMCDNMHGVSPTRETHPSVGVQTYWASLHT